MQIKAIKEIKNIGTFANFLNGASLRFEKLTFIYGYNTFGKTTLTDIFKSLRNRDSSKISSRKSIPNINESQKVKLSVKDSENESNLIYQSNNWGTNNVSQNLEIFGTEFIYENVFTGYSIERNNRVNFTNFILGEEGVELANEIASKKKEARSKKSNLKNKVPTFIKNKGDWDVKRFIDYSIEKLNIDEIEIELSKKKIEKEKESNRLKEPKTILDLPNINNFHLPDFKIIEYFENINESLQKNYSNIRDEILEKINKHISSNFINTQSSEKWIKNGLDNCKSKSGKCIFCGQNLQNAKDLINAYETYFNEEYENFIKKIEETLNKNLIEINNFNFSYKTILQEILNNSFKFKEYLSTNKSFLDNLEILEISIKNLNEEELNKSKKEILEKFKNASKEKNKKPHTKIGKINYEDFSNKQLFYTETLKTIYETIDKINEKIVQFKNQYKDIEKIKEKIMILNIEIKKLEYKKARIEQDHLCKNYIEKQKEIDVMGKEIKYSEKKLKEEQSQYLNNYFNTIDELFQRFGSRDFKLTKETSTRGDLPVYSIKVKFKNIEIGNNELQTVFSESDRRALALAIFWTKICLKPEQERKNTIVILDDPVTSFDDNRITNTIALFKESLDSLSQIIILTHYPIFIKNFCEKTNENQITTKFFRIEKNHETSFLKDQDRKEFTTNQYEKTFSKIYGFINREHTDCIKNDLRKFLESLYIPTLFAKELKEAKRDNLDISSLEKKIDIIFDDGDIKNKFQSFRKNLNPDHHSYTLDNGEEDIRNFAMGFMEFLYSFEFKQSQ